MNEWFTLAEILALQLPGVPATPRDLQRLATAEGWSGDAARSRVRDARSGAVEYHVSLLPAAARADLFAREVLDTPARAKAAKRETLWAAFDKASAKARAEARRRLAIVAEIEAAAGRAGLTAAIGAASARHGIARTTCGAWVKLARSGERPDRLALLLPGHTGRQAVAACHPDAYAYLKADWLRPEQPALTACYRRLEDAARRQGWAPIPSMKTLQRRIERELPRAAIVLARQGADAARALYPAQTRDRSHFHAMQAVNVDGHKFDVFVRWPDGEVARPLMVAFQDLATNLIVGHRVDRSENREAVRLAIGDMIETHGIPEHVYLDNGRAFASKWISGRAANRYRFKIKEDEPTGILTELGCTLHWTTPYSGQSKPIERAFRELAEEIAKHPKCAGAYTGNRPDTKPENYATSAVPIDVFEALVAAEILRFNLRPNRRTRAAGGTLSFADLYRASMARDTTLVRKATAAQRRLFLMAAEGVTAAPRNGAITLMGNRYWSEELVEVAGRKVVARFDPQAMHAPLHVYTLDGRFVASAECIEATGFSDASAAREHSARRNAYMRKLRDIRDLARTISPEDLAAMLPEAEAVALPAPKVVQMVRKTMEPERREAEDAFVRGSERLFGEVVKFGG